MQRYAHFSGFSSTLSRAEIWLVSVIDLTLISSRDAAVPDLSRLIILIAAFEFTSLQNASYTVDVAPWPRRGLDRPNFYRLIAQLHICRE